MSNKFSRELEKVEEQMTVQNFLDIKSNKSIFLDKSFQVGSDTESRWGPDEEGRYSASLINNMAPSSIVLVDVKKCFEIFDELKTDLISLHYFKNLLDQGYTYVSIDGNNRTITLQGIADGRVAIPADTYSLKNTQPIVVEKRKDKKDKGLSPVIIDKIMSRQLNITVYTDISVLEMSILFRNINDGMPLNAHHKRQSYSSVLAELIRDYAVIYKSSLQNIFSPKDIKVMKGDEFIAKCLSYVNNRKYAKVDLDNMYMNPQLTINTNLRKKSDFKTLIKSYLKEIEDYKFPSKNSAFDLFTMIWDYKISNQKITDMKKFVNIYCLELIKLQSNAQTFQSPEVKDNKLVDQQMTYSELLSKTLSGNLFSDYRKDIMRARLEKELIDKEVLVQLADPNNRFFTYKQKYELWIKQDHKCPLTKKHIEMSDILDHTKFHADHIKPFDKGGKTTIENGQLVCAIANMKKSNKYKKV